MNGPPHPRRLVAVLLASLGIGAAQAQLNDTGQATCYDGSALVPCTAANTGDAAPYPRQDGRFGRDAAATSGVLAKTGGGAAGFDFTPLAADGTEIPLTGNPPVPSATPTCIRDNHTHLTWEVKTDDGGLRDADWTYTSYDSTYADLGDNATDGGPDGVWAGPQDTGVGSYSDNCGNPNKICTTERYVADVNSAGLCGAHDWRMPTVDELHGIVDCGRTYPSIDSAWFSDIRSNSFWSSSPYARRSDYAWNVNFHGGGNGIDGYLRSGGEAVRLVRGGSSTPAAPITPVGGQVCKPAIPASTPTSQFVNHGNGTVTDTHSGLMWKQCAEGQSGSDCTTGSVTGFTWPGALQQTVVVNGGGGYAGYNDWRLPNIKELRSIVETQCWGPAINLSVFPNDPASFVWSSSSYAYNLRYAWRVPPYGGAYDGLRDDLAAVRLVRGGQSLAAYDAFTYAITTNANPVAGGTVSCTPNPVSHGSNSDCTATPNAGYSFTDWGGDCTGTGACACALSNVTAAKTVTGNFRIAGARVPAVGAWGLGLLAGLLAVLGGVRMRLRHV